MELCEPEGELNSLTNSLKTSLNLVMDSGVRRQFTGKYSSGNEDPGIPLSNLSVVSQKMESLQEFLAESVRRNTLLEQDQMEMVSTEISSAIHQIIVNGTALLTCWQSLGCRSCSGYDLPTNTKDSEIVDVEGSSSKVVEIDAVELLAEHVHFCEICGKGFKRDANLRMHMRAHGNQFKTPEALAKPTEPPPSSNRFSCPFVGCNRNKSHNKFQPLKSVICVKNHFKRSHCPKMYSCNRCNNKSFSVISDLKSHIKHCGESKWRCSCGTTFSRKDKLFQHMALFEGHMPAEEDDEKKPSIMMSMGGAALKMEEHGEKRRLMVDTQLGMGMGGDLGFNGRDPDPDPDPGLFDGLLDGLGSFESDYLKDVFGSPMPDTRIEGLFDMQSIASGSMERRKRSRQG